MKLLDFEQNVLLAPYTSWIVGGPAEYFYLPKSVEQLKQAQSWVIENAKPLSVIGGGSNVLIADEGVPGLTICLKKMSGVTERIENGFLYLDCLSGTSKSELLKILLKNQLQSAIFLAGIPGDVGGGVVMNAGVGEMISPREFTEITDWVEVLKPNGDLVVYKHEDLTWSYRHCEGWRPGIITRVGFKIKLDPDPSVIDRVRAANKIRLQKQPLDMPSCGSVFVNPPGHKAAQLIESCGLKGYRIGQAQVSTKHANFIVNLGGAKSAEIWDLIKFVQAQVLGKTGIQLNTEVVTLGQNLRPYSDIS